MAEQTDLGPARTEPGPRTARRAARGAHARPEEPAHGSFWRELPILLLVAFGLAFLIKTFVVQAFYIPSGSMENTLQVGDRVLVNKVVYHVRSIERGDVVVFNGVDSFTPEVSVQEPEGPVAEVVTWFGRAFGFAQQVIGHIGPR